MLEVTITAVFVSIAVLTVGHRRHDVVSSAPVDLLTVSGDAAAGNEPLDLPCPWCRAQTREDDRQCPSCGQPFG